MGAIASASSCRQRQQALARRGREITGQQVVIVNRHAWLQTGTDPRGKIAG